MSFKTSAKQDKRSKDLTSLFCLLLLLSYLIGPSRLEGVHEFFHDHQAEVEHSDEAENDPCHRTIYHESKQEEKCGHHAHLIVSDSCELCDLIAHTDIALVPDPSAVKVLFFNNSSVHSVPVSLRLTLSLLSSRAPPVV